MNDLHIKRRPAGKVVEDGAGGIAGTVVTDHHLVGRASLGQIAVELLGQEVGAVIGAQRDGYATRGRAGGQALGPELGRGRGTGLGHCPGKPLLSGALSGLRASSTNSLCRKKRPTNCGKGKE